MRSPAQIARALGGHEAKRAPQHDGLCHAPNPIWRAVASECARKAGHKGVHRCDGFAWSPDANPRLVVSVNWPEDGAWYQIVDHKGTGRGSWAPTHAAALALGLAALDTTRSHR